MGKWLAIPCVNDRTVSRWFESLLNNSGGTIDVSKLNEESEKRFRHRVATRFGTQSAVHRFRIMGERIFRIENERISLSSEVH